MVGHLSRNSSCPFTGNSYEICDRCGKRSLLGKTSNKSMFDEKTKSWSVS
jgi:hypothetical protein